MPMNERQTRELAADLVKAQADAGQVAYAFEHARHLRGEASEAADKDDALDEAMARVIENRLRAPGAAARLAELQALSTKIVTRIAELGG